MQNKRLFLSLALVLLLVAAAAFLVGRMFNTRVGTLVEDGPARGGQVFTFSSTNNVTPAPELPTTGPEIVGLYVEMKDTSMTVQIVDNIGGLFGDSSVDVNNAPKVEVIMTSTTAIYRDLTRVVDFSAATQQLVEKSTLDYLTPQAMIRVWGDGSGDRIVARVLLYSNSLEIRKP